MSENEEHLNGDLEEMQEKIRANKNCDWEKDSENCNSGPSSSGNKHLEKKHISRIFHFSPEKHTFLQWQTREK